jgi:hypothetical protein
MMIAVQESWTCCKHLKSDERVETRLTKWLLLEEQEYCIDQFNVFGQVIKLKQVSMYMQHQIGTDVRT